MAQPSDEAKIAAIAAAKEIVLALIACSPDSFKNPDPYTVGEKAAKAYKAVHAEIIAGLA
jgi:hypothetical protein